MFGWVFQETSFLTVRRSIFVASFLLIFIVWYEVSIPVPFSNVGTTSPGGKELHVVEYLHSAAFLMVYLFYLLERSRSLGREHLNVLKYERRKKLTETEKFLEGSREHLKELQNIQTNNPPSMMLPSKEDLEQIRKNLTVNIDLSPILDAIPEFDNKLKKLQELQKELHPIFQRYNEGGVPGANNQSRYNIPPDDEPEIVEKKIKEAVVLNSQLTFGLERAHAPIGQLLSQIEKAASKIKEQYLAEEITPWVEKMKTLVQEQDASAEELLEGLGKDASNWDVRFPRIVACSAVGIAALVIGFR